MNPLIIDSKQPTKADDAHSAQDQDEPFERKKPGAILCQPALTIIVQRAQLC